MGKLAPKLLFLMPCLLAASLQSTPARATPEQDAALKFLDAVDYESRLKSQLNFARTGIPAVDALFLQISRDPGFQALARQLAEQGPRLRVQLADVYAAKFSEAELNALADFFRTPVGRKYTQLFSDLQQSEATLVLQGLVAADPKIGQALDSLARVSQKRDAEVVNLESRAETGDRAAMYRLGNLYCSNGMPVMERNERLAKCFDWKKRAADAGLPEAQFDIGFSYIDGRYGNGRSGAEMFRWMKLAAEQGHPASQFYVGSAYAGNASVYSNLPTGVEVNGKEAVRWLEKAAGGGSAGATMNVAAIHMEGRIVARDVDRAVFWYSQAAAKRNTAAMRRLGEIYESGAGGEPNLAEAMKWYKQAAGIPLRDPGAKPPP
jgi:TPR repeat protein